MPAAASNTLTGGICQKPLDLATCTFRLTFTSTTYDWTTPIAGYSGGGGKAVVNGTEIDFFNGAECKLKPPLGVGRYTWTVEGSTVQFASLNADECLRGKWLAGQSYIRPAGI